MRQRGGSSTRDQASGTPGNRPYLAGCGEPYRQDRDQITARRDPVGPGRVIQNADNPRSRRTFA